MKRSEMIYTMVEILDDALYDEEISKEICEAILSALEYKGMLPPSIAKQGFIHKIHSKYKSIHLKWEKE